MQNSTKQSQTTKPAFILSECKRIAAMASKIDSLEGRGVESVSSAITGECKRLAINEGISPAAVVNAYVAIGEGDEVSALRCIKDALSSVS